MDNYLQFKLTNGDEIIAEVVEEPDDDGVNLVVRKAMQIYPIESSDTGYRYYAFKPWMIYQIRTGFVQLLNYTHIIGEAKPDLELLSEYHKALEQEMKTAEEKEAELKSKIEEMYGELIERLRGSDVDIDLDSDAPTNIVKFSNKKKLH